MKCRVLEKGNCEITQGYNDNHHANDIVGGGYTLDYVVAHTEGKVIILQDGYNNIKGRVFMKRNKFIANYSSTSISGK